MMKEIELKVLEVNAETVKGKLEKLGFKKVFEGMIHSCYFDMNGKLRETGRVLRLRRRGDTTLLTYKEVTYERFKKALEIELEVSSFDEMKAILERLGFKVYLRITKHRISYKGKDGNVVLDTIIEPIKIPTYAEIESSSSRKVDKIIRKLGLSDMKIVNWNEETVINYYMNTLRKAD